MVRLLRRYYATVQLPASVPVGLMAHRFLPPLRDLPAADRDGVSRFLARGVSIHCLGSSTPRGHDALALMTLTFTSRNLPSFLRILARKRHLLVTDCHKSPGCQEGRSETTRTFAWLLRKARCKQKPSHSSTQECWGAVTTKGEGSFSWAGQKCQGQAGLAARFTVYAAAPRSAATARRA